MNEIASKARENEKEKLSQQYDLYVKTYVGNKIFNSAKKGKNECVIKIKKSIPVFEVVNRLQDSSKDFKAIAHYNGSSHCIKVKW